jgi:hypothetical protein
MPNFDINFQEKLVLLQEINRHIEELYKLAGQGIMVSRALEEAHQNKQQLFESLMRRYKLPEH